MWNNNALYFLGAFHLSKYLLISPQNTPARQIRDGWIQLLSRTSGTKQLSGCIKHHCPQFGADSEVDNKPVSCWGCGENLARQNLITSAGAWPVSQGSPPSFHCFHRGACNSVRFSSHSKNDLAPWSGVSGCRGGTREPFLGLCACLVSPKIRPGAFYPGKQSSLPYIEIPSLVSPGQSELHNMKSLLFAFAACNSEA